VDDNNLVEQDCLAITRDDGSKVALIKHKNLEILFYFWD